MLVHHWRMSDAEHDLNGKTILVTRTEKQSRITASEIRKRGGNPIVFPCMEVERLDSNIRSALPILQGNPTTILFTSGNGVDCVAEVLGNAFAMLLKPHRLIAVGEITAAALANYGVNSHIEPDNPSQAGLIGLFERIGAPEHLLFFRAKEGSDAVAKSLSTKGSKVKTIYAYRMRCPEADATEIANRMAAGGIDGVLLGSARTTANYIRRIGSIETAGIPAIVVISPQVAAFAEKEGLKVQAVAKRASFDAMLDALSEYFSEHGA